MVIDPHIHDLSYSIRRYFVDDFFFRNILEFPPGSRILDIGGKKTYKRGQFDIEKYGLNVEYVNIAKETEPTYLCDITNIPVSNDSFDGIICSEVLEHVKEPNAVLKEAYRILKLGGIMLISVPFLFPIHPDPYDYGRYTDHFWKSSIEEAGFSNIEIELQGLLFSVIMNMLKLFAYEMDKEGRPKNKWKRIFFYKAIAWGEKKALKLETKAYFSKHPFFKRFTTGFGIVTKKLN